MTSMRMIDYKVLLSLREDAWNKQKYCEKSMAERDFVRLVDLNKFSFLSLRSCSNNETVDLVIIVSSAPNNKEQRMALRETWGAKRDGVKMFFMIGEVQNQKLQEDLDREFNIYSDLIQGNFRDSYRNLTYKFIMGLKFVTYYCKQATYVLKTDDDTFVNMPVLLNYIKTIPFNQHLIVCNTMKRSPAIRQLSKWRVDFNDYPKKFYPDYCSGFAVLFTYNTVFDIYQEAQKGDFFWVDDAFVTGMCTSTCVRNVLLLENSCDFALHKIVVTHIPF